MKQKVDLPERTVKFSEDLISLIRKLSKDTVNDVIAKQLLRSGTSIGANYAEANCAESRKDFEHKIGICKKEANETKYWLQVLIKADPKATTEARVLWREAHELYLIFVTVIKSSRRNSGKH